MSTQVLTQTQAPRFGLFALLNGFTHSFTLAMQYRDLVEMSDAQLAARGLKRDDLSKKFIDDLGQI